MSDEPGPLSLFTADQKEWIEQLVTACVASTGVGATASLPIGTSEPSIHYRRDAHRDDPCSWGSR